MAWQAIAANLAVTAGVALWNKIFAPGEKKQPKPRPEEIEFPTTSIGAPIPIVYGTARIDSPALIWIGNESWSYDDAINENVYRADMLFSIGVPPSTIAGSVEAPTLQKFWYGDVLTTGGFGILHGNYQIANASSYLDQRVFYGAVEFFDGRADQVLTNTPSTPDYEIDEAFVRDGFTRATVPGYRWQMLVGVIGSFARAINGRLGVDPRVQQVSCVVRARGYEPMEWPNLYDANPAWAIYDLICSPVWKLGYSTDRVDLASFQAAATTLIEEDHGISLSVLSDTDVVEVIAGIADQIDAAIYEDPSDGKIKIHLIRAADITESIPELTPEDCQRPKLNIIFWSDAANHLDVSYTNRDRDYKRDTATAQRLSNAVGQDNRLRKRTVDYPFCHDAQLAARLADRELSVLGRPIITADVHVSRKFSSLMPGDPVRCSWPDLNIVEKVFRVGDVDHGQLASGMIRLTLVEDVFDKGEGGNAPGEEEVVSPFLLPVHERYVGEAPWYLINKLYAQGAISSNTLQYLFAIAVNEDDAYATGCASQIEEVPWYDVPQGGFAVSGTLAQSYPRFCEPIDEDGLVVEATGASAQYLLVLSVRTPLTDAGLSAGNRLAVIFHDDGVTHEIITYSTLSHLGTTDGVSRFRFETVWRGLLDTPAIDHPAGARFMLFGTSNVGRGGFDPDATVEPVPVVSVPIGSGLTGSGDDAVDEVQVYGRASLPLAPVDVRVASDEQEGIVGTSDSYMKKITFFDQHGTTTGSRRKRLATSLLSGFAATETVEGGTTYSVLAQKQNVGEDPDSEVELHSGLADPISTIVLGKAGAGEIDVILRAVSGSDQSFSDAIVRATAPQWRNLITNGHARDSSTLGWTNVTGTVGTSTGDTPSRIADACAFSSATASGGVTAFRQDVEVSGFPAARLSAICDFYFKNAGADADDTITVVVAALDSGGSSLGTATSGALVGHATYWKRATVSYASLPANTAKLRVTVTLTAAGGGDTAPGTMVADLSLRLGQLSSQLLANPTFDDAGGPAWTVDATSSKAIPQNATEMTALLAAAGLSGTASSIWLAQEASGSLLDSVGSINLTVTGTLARQQAVAGWAADSTDFDEGVSEYAGVSGGAPNINTTSVLVLAYLDLGAQAAAQTNVMFLGSDVSIEYTSAEKLSIGFFGASSGYAYTNGSFSGTVVPVVIQIDNTNQRLRLYTHKSRASMIYATPSATNATYFYFGGLVYAAPPMGLIYGAQFTGATAQLSDANVKSLLEEMGWTVEWEAGVSIRKTGGVSGNYDAQSYSSATYSGAISIEWTMGHGDDAVGVGISLDNPDANYTGIDRLILTDSGSVYKSENGSLTLLTTYVASDQLKLERDGSNNITAYKKTNGGSWTSIGTLTSLSGSVIVDTTFRFTTDRVDGLTVINGGSPVTVTWNNTNTTVTT
jgi:hypothetical protein